MRRVKLIKKAKEGLSDDKHPRCEFDNYRSGIEITNQVGGHGPASPDRER